MRAERKRRGRGECARCSFLARINCFMQHAYWASTTRDRLNKAIKWWAGLIQLYSSPAEGRSVGYNGEKPFPASGCITRQPNIKE